MHILEIFTIILAITTFITYLNERFLKISPTIAALLISLFFSIILLLGHQIIPSFGEAFQQMMQNIHFDKILLKIMLGCLLFAGAFNLDVKMLSRVKTQVLSSAIFGTILSSILFAILFFGVSEILNLEIPLIYALLFGTLISPTDPIATLAILKENKVEKSVEYKIAGESLFNDAIGVVLFTSVLGIIETGVDSFSMGQLIYSFLKEAIGGVLFGCLIGFLSTLFLKKMTSRTLIILFSISLVFSISLLSERFGISQPLSVISCGLVLSSQKNIIENNWPSILEGFWEDLDGMLNLILFILIGLESVLIFEYFTTVLIVCGVLGIAVTLLSRLLSVAILLIPENMEKKEFKGMLTVLTWGALRGGLGFALALSIPISPQRNIIVLVTYIIVIFSIIVQGLSIGKVSGKYLVKNKP
jgi:Na+:H+ antiporter